MQQESRGRTRPEWSHHANVQACGSRGHGGGVAVRFTFLVTGGWLNAAKLPGTI
jgi:hypothetical protein